jgi:hypothetical protein
MFAHENLLVLRAAIATIKIPLKIRSETKNERYLVLWLITGLPSNDLKPDPKG